jgi:hypothetical protein
MEVAKGTSASEIWRNLKKLRNLATLDKSFLGRIIAIDETFDETWIPSYDPLNNNQARERLLLGKKQKKQRNVSKF